MEKSTIIGLILGVSIITVGLVLKGASLGALWNPAAYLIIFGGTAASLFIGFPMHELKKIPSLFKFIFTEQVLIPKRELIQTFVQLATIARREGILSLEDKLKDLNDEFLKNGVQLVIDGTDPEMVRNVLLEEIQSTEERHRLGALIFTQAGTYAPTLGVLGAVIGLIAALGNLSDIEKLGHSIAAAFIATLLGIFSGYVLWHPIANKLKRMSNNEMENKYLIVEGISSLQSGISPRAIEQNLLVYLSSDERRWAAEQNSEVSNNG